MKYQVNNKGTNFVFTHVHNVVTVIVSIKFFSAFRKFYHMHMEVWSVYILTSYMHLIVVIWVIIYKL